MNKKITIIISLVFIGVVFLGFIAITFLFKEKQTLPSKATGPSCPVNSGSCTWSSDDSATSFDVKIIDQTTGTTILTTTTSNKKVDFTPEVGHIYKCLVTPVNSCGKGSESTDTTTCTVITGTLTPSPSITVTPTLPPDSTPTVTPEISLTPTLTLTPSPTSGPTATDTPGPSPTPGPSATPIPVACGTKSCDNTTNPCRSGLSCIQANDGSNYCSLPEFQDACKVNPAQETCCTAQGENPTPTEIVLVNATATPGAGGATTVAQVTEIPPAGIATFGKIFTFISLAVILLGLIL